MNLYNSFNISPDRGFLPVTNPLCLLPQGYQPWDEIGHALPELLIAGILRAEVERLPLLDAGDLQSEVELERAMQVLSFIAHAYLRGGQQELHSLPKQLAVPWKQVAAKLGRPPVLAHASAVLHNWRPIDPHGPIDLSNLALIQHFNGGKDEAWFFLVTVMIEYQGAGVIRGIMEILDGKKDTSGSLNTIIQALASMTNTIKRMQEHCDPYIFYNRLRPYLASISGVIYEGVSDEPMYYAGGSAAQSSLVQSLDAALGVAHNEQASSAFLLEMRRYMPQKHRMFIEWLEKSRPLANLGQNYSDQVAMLREALLAFRSEHLKIYHVYVAAQQKKTSLGDTGTGGTDAAAFLRQVRNDTKPNQ